MAVRSATKIRSLDLKSTVNTSAPRQLSIWSIAFSPDGKILASGSWDMTIKVWDMATGQVIHTLGGV